MAVLVLTDAFVMINAVNYSAVCTKAEVDLSADVLESTAFSVLWKTRAGGLKDGGVALTFNNDFAVSGLDATMFGFLGTAQTFEIRPTSAARSTTNPAFTGSLLVAEWKPLGNSVGELATVDVTFPTTGPVLRQTS